MPLIKFSVTTSELAELTEQAEDENLSLQDYLRLKLFEIRPPAIFTPEEAERRALEKFTPEDGPFTLPEVYGDDIWALLNPRMTGVFGRKFYGHIQRTGTIEFVGTTPGRRRTKYRIVRKDDCNGIDKNREKDN